MVKTTVNALLTKHVIPMLAIVVYSFIAWVTEPSKEKVRYIELQYEQIQKRKQLKEFEKHYQQSLKKAVPKKAAKKTSFEETAPLVEKPRFFYVKVPHARKDKKYKVLIKKARKEKRFLLRKASLT